MYRLGSAIVYKPGTSRLWAGRWRNRSTWQPLPPRPLRDSLSVTLGKEENMLPVDRYHFEFRPNFYGSKLNHPEVDL
ncbi:hypothetical protein J6590_004761 [Homalodisca vitripennis]|nr:hypothetical protein J6590_004761 [Homalodisca vitripennis]